MQTIIFFWISNYHDFFFSRLIKNEVQIKFYVYLKMEKKKFHWPYLISADTLHSPDIRKTHHRSNYDNTTKIPTNYFIWTRKEVFIFSKLNLLKEGNFSFVLVLARQNVFNIIAMRRTILMKKKKKNQSRCAFQVILIANLDKLLTANFSSLFFHTFFFLGMM